MTCPKLFHIFVPHMWSMFNIFSCPYNLNVGKVYRIAFAVLLGNISKIRQVFEMSLSRTVRVVLQSVISF
jgi:hypothetical protein